MSDPRRVGRLPALTVTLLVAGLLIWWAGNDATHEGAHAGGVEQEPSSSRVIGSAGIAAPRAAARERALREARADGAPLAPGTVRVHALDPASGAPLDGLRVVHDPRRGQAWRTPHAAHPGPSWRAHVLAEAERSPVQLELGRGRGTTYWIGAEGRAWASLSLPAGSSGEHTVMLAPAGELAIDVRGILTGHLIHLRLFDDALTPPLLFDLGVQQDMALDFEGWPAGTFLAHLEVGDAERSQVLAGELAEVVACERCELELTLPALEGDTELGRIEGTLALPALIVRDESLSAAFRLELLPLAPTPAHLARQPVHYTRSLAELYPVDATGELVQFEFHDLPPGGYALLARPFGLLQEVELAPRWTLALELAVPDLARARLRFVREPGGEAVTLSDVSAHAEGGERFAVGALAVHVRPDRESGEVELVALPGPVRLQATDAGLRRHVERLVLAAGHSEHELLLRAPLELTVQLLDAGRPLAVPLEWWFEVEVLPDAAAGELVTRVVSGSRSGVAGHAAEARFDLSGPGRYRLVFPPLADGRRPAARVVDLGAAAPTPVLIELASRR